MSVSQTATVANGIAPAHAGKPRNRTTSFPGTLVHRVREYFRCQRDYRYLLELPDHLLKDIGLDRMQVQAEMQRRLF